MAHNKALQIIIAAIICCDVQCQELPDLIFASLRGIAGRIESLSLQFTEMDARFTTKTEEMDARLTTISEEMDARLTTISEELEGGLEHLQGQLTNLQGSSIKETVFSVFMRILEMERKALHQVVNETCQKRQVESLAKELESMNQRVEERASIQQVEMVLKELESMNQRVDERASIQQVEMVLKEFPAITRGLEQCSKSEEIESVIEELESMNQRVDERASVQQVEMVLKEFPAITRGLEQCSKSVDIESVIEEIRETSCVEPYQFLIGIGCIYIHKESKTWDASREMCKELGGDLFVAHNPDHYLRLAKHFIDINHAAIKKYMWVGVKEGAWLSGRKVAPQEEAPRNPEMSSGKCSYTDGDTAEKFLLWTDPCSRLNWPICEKKLS